MKHGAEKGQVVEKERSSEKGKEAVELKACINIDDDAIQRPEHRTLIQTHTFAQRDHVSIKMIICIMTT